MNHCVGKWHLGHFKKEYTPLQRGFKSHIGYWTGHHDYFDHTAYEHQSWGFDIRRNMDVAFDLHGQYTTDIITSESVRIIHTHNTSDPLFLYVAHAAVHSGNPYNPLPAPDTTTSKFTQITDFNRRKYAGEELQNAQYQFHDRSKCYSIVCHFIYLPLISNDDTYGLFCRCYRSCIGTNKNVR